jgi:exosortase/archaeosortase family protein
VRGPVLPAAPEVRELLDRSREVIEALEAGQQPTTMALSEALDQLEAQVDRAREMHRAHLDRRLAEQKAHIQNHLGPTVTYIARAIRPQTRREALQSEIVNVECDSSLDEGARKQRVNALQAKLDRATAAASPSADEDETTERRFSFNVVPDCGALPLMAIYLAAVVAFPVSWRKRFAGLLVGLPALYVINIARLSCLAVIGSWTGGGEWFEFAHEYVWQALYIIIVVVLWLLWVEVIVKENRLWRTAPA